jgi:hypothetical protein
MAKPTPDGGAHRALDHAVDADHLARALSRGPPELPGLIGASVCSKLRWTRPLPGHQLRCTALMMPWVTVCSRPKRTADGNRRLADLDLIRIAQRATGVFAGRST